MVIESKDNQRFKSWMKLKLKKHRDETNLFLVYGKKLVDLALAHGVCEEVVTTNPEIEGTLISEKLMKELSQTETTFDVMAVCKKVSNPIQSDKILVLDDVQNPDNVGALLRSALAFGFKHVILSQKSADLYNEKTIRASQGAIFDVYVERLNLVEFLTLKKDEGYQVFGADAHASKNQPEEGPIILVLGNEGNGLSNEVKELANGFINIKTETVESLNVVVAGSILMYEWGKVR
ncbi:TrmH family RNA methyltransferase [Acholeplasma hippikon]|nr:RNA methyltransferase [Acholeplasma hippikon]